jgi:hypothetical protein
MQHHRQRVALDRRTDFGGRLKRRPPDWRMIRIRMASSPATDFRASSILDQAAP